MPPKSGWDDRVNVFFEFQILDLGKARSYVFGERSIDADLDHAVAGMPKLSEPRSGHALALEAGMIAFLHVDSDDILQGVFQSQPCTCSTQTIVTPLS